MTVVNPSRLTRVTLSAGVTALAAQDQDLKRVLTEYGPPPLWARPAGFATLVMIILEQQVSLASGRATFARLQCAFGEISPETLHGRTVDELRAAGVTRQKAGYCLGLADAIVSGELDLPRLARMDDHAARAALVGLRGIGPWTADVYLMMALRRPDCWPTGDLALAEAARRVKGLAARPPSADLDVLAEQWRPWRAVAARMLWHAYLSAARARKELKAGGDAIAALPPVG